MEKRESAVVLVTEGMRLVTNEKDLHPDHIEILMAWIVKCVNEDTISKISTNLFGLDMGPEIAETLMSNMREITGF